MGKSRRREHGQLEVQRLEGGAFRERCVCDLVEEYSGGQMPGWRERMQGRARRPWASCWDGAQPLRDDSGQSMRCLEAPCSPDHISFEYPGNGRGKRKEGE